MLTERRVLLVDDEPLVRELLASALRDERFAVDLATTVDEAKAHLVARAYDLVVADWRLPDGDGRLVADWAAELGAKTIVMSGYLAHMSGGRAHDHETLMKPIRVGDFLALVRRAVR